VFDILLKFSMLNNLGASFTMKSLDEENYLDLIYLQLCLNYQSKYLEMQQRKVTHINKGAL